MLCKLNISRTTTCPRIVNLHLEAQDASNCKYDKTTMKYNKTENTKKRPKKDLRILEGIDK
jgi:hypothetical protein